MSFRPNAKVPPEAVDQLVTDGYVIVEGGVRPLLCNVANADLDEFKRRNRRTLKSAVDHAGRLPQLMNLHLVVDALATVFSENTALDVCDQFFGDETVLAGSLLSESHGEPGVRAEVGMDGTHPTARHLMVWVALDDVSSDNGPLLVVPGSHHDAAGDADSPPIQLELHRGDVVVSHPRLHLGSAPPLAPRRTRRTVLLHVRPLGDGGSQDYMEHNTRKMAAVRRVVVAERSTWRVKLLVRPGAGVGERLEVTGRILKQRLLTLRNRALRSS